jgi:hypothetical protein
LLLSITLLSAVDGPSVHHHPPLWVISQSNGRRTHVGGNACFTSFLTLPTQISELGFAVLQPMRRRKEMGQKKNVVLAELAALIFDVEEEGPEIRSRFQKHVPKHTASLNHYLIKLCSVITSAC